MAHVVVPIVLVAALAGTAEAQPGRGSLAASYDLLRDHEQGATYPRGFSLSADVRVYRWVGAALEVSRSNRSEDFRESGGGLFEMRYESVRGGLRFARPTGRVRPFMQALAGRTRWLIRQRRDPVGEESLAWESVTDPALTPGAGVDAFFTRYASVRVGADLAFLFRRDSRFGNSYRTRLSSLHAGVAVHWGED